MLRVHGIYPQVHKADDDGDTASRMRHQRCSKAKPVSATRPTVALLHSRSIRELPDSMQIEGETHLTTAGYAALSERVLPEVLAVVSL